MNVNRGKINEKQHRLFAWEFDKVDLYLYIFPSFILRAKKETLIDNYEL